MGRDAPPPAPPPRPRLLSAAALLLVAVVAAAGAAPSLSLPSAAAAVATAPRPCVTHGVLYLHGQQVLRPDPCELCLCLDGALFCWWQHCPTGADGDAASGPCRASRALAACANASAATAAAAAAAATASASPAPDAASASAAATAPSAAASSATAADATSTSPANSSCHVMGREYRFGEVLPRDTGTCLECVCGAGGRVTCAPKDCVVPDAAADGRSPAASLDMFDVDTF